MPHRSRISGITQPRNSWGPKEILTPPSVMWPLTKKTTPERIVKGLPEKGRPRRHRRNVRQPRAAALPRRYGVSALVTDSSSCFFRHGRGPRQLPRAPCRQLRGGGREALFAAGADVHVQAV